MPGPDPRRQSLDSRNKMGAFPKEAIKREKIIFSLKKDKPKPEQPKTKSVAKPNKFLSGGQSKLDKNKNNRIDAEDFALLRKEKSKGKPMKAKRGKFNDVKKFAKAKGLPIPLASALPKGTLPKGFGKALGNASFAPIGNFPAINTAPGSVASKAQVKQGTKRLGGKGRVGTALALGAVGVGAIAKKIKERMDKRKAKKRDTAKVKKMGGGLAAATERLRAQGKMGGGMMKKYNKGMTDKTFTDPKTAMIAHSLKTKDKISRRDREAAKILEKEAPKGLYSSIMSRKKAIDKLKATKKILGKMGGGMMNKPMGYKSGKSVMAKGCKLGRKKPTKMYT